MNSKRTLSQLFSNYLSYFRAKILRKKKTKKDKEEDPFIYPHF